MGVKLVSASGGSVEINPPTTASNFTATMPAATGTVVVGASAVSAVGQIPFSTDGTSYTPTAKIVSATAVTSTSGTNIDFTGIPSWVKRITVLMAGVSTSGTSGLTVQIGTSGGVVTTGYLGASDSANAGINPNLYSTGFNVEDVTSTAAFSRHYTCVLNNITGNTWVFSIIGGVTTAGNVSFGGGSLALGGVLDRVRVTALNGTDTFDAGTINILYE